MSAHLLIVGNGREIPGMVHDWCPDVRTTVLVRRDKARKVRGAERHERIIGLDPTRPQEWVAVAQDIHRRDPFDFLGSYAEKDQEKAALVGAALGLRTHAVDTVAAVFEKTVMRDRLASAGVESTAAQRVESVDDAYDFGKRFGYPIVLKPVFGSASSGVSIVAREEDVPAAWSWGKAAKEPDRPDLMVEEYLAGPEISVEAFSYRGEHTVIALTDKYKEPRHCVEIGHAVRGAFSDETVASVSGYVCRVLDALGVEDGPTHTELVLTDAGPRVVETHLRPGGDDIAEMLADTYRLDLNELMVRQSLGEDVRRRLAEGLDRMAASTVYPAIWYGVPQAAGQIVAIDGADDAREFSDVVSVHLELGVGDELPAEITDSRSRAVAVRAVGPSPHAAIETARAVTQMIRFTVRPTYAFTELRRDDPPR